VREQSSTTGLRFFDDKEGGARMKVLCADEDFME
jgi:hypothetical protein